jgi:O-acetyl-ADP-ribose deacetylase (regulator of RNase III)
MGTVIVTHGGHELSDLVRNGVRYIFHCATVHVDPNFRERIMPMDDDASITRAVLNCLDKVLEVDKQEGMVFPANTESGAREARLPKPHVPIKSIIFPVFGTGEGGLSVAEVAPAMIRAFKRFLRENKSITLEKIYLGVFSERDIPPIEEMLDREFNRES